ncbi:hypothetical protein EGW08_019333, partial [Elysia chlorotica]
DSGCHGDCLVRCEALSDGYNKNNVLESSCAVYNNAKEAKLGVFIPEFSSADDLKPDYNLASISPSADLVISLLDNPSTTSQDLQQAMDKLKDKQSQIRRKRMAVHDKRQRVSTDGERLAC